MCSPVGHSLAALVIGTTKKSNRLTLNYLVFCIFSGVVADLDFLIGWYMGDLNGYHHLGSHSVFAAILYGFIVYGMIRFFKRPEEAEKLSSWPFLGVLMYLSHIVLDWLAEDNSEPVGLQLLWPLSDQFMASPVSLFPRFVHEAEGADILGMVANLFSRHNFSVMILELAIFLPLLLLMLWRKFRTSR